MQKLASPFPYAYTPLTILSLLRGNRNNRVSVEVRNVPVCSVLRPVAKHFSRTWRRELANIHCTSIIIVTMPAPTSSPNALVAPSGSAPQLTDDASADTQENPKPTSTDKNAVMFVVQWMERGRADAVGKEPLLYPGGNVKELQRLRYLVTALGVDPLLSGRKGTLPLLSPNSVPCARRQGKYFNSRILFDS